MTSKTASKNPPQKASLGHFGGCFLQNNPKNAPSILMRGALKKSLFVDIFRGCLKQMPPKMPKRVNFGEPVLELILEAARKNEGH